MKSFKIVANMHLYFNNLSIVAFKPSKSETTSHIFYHWNPVHVMSKDFISIIQRKTTLYKSNLAFIQKVNPKHIFYILHLDYLYNHFTISINPTSQMFEYKTS